MKYKVDYDVTKGSLVRYRLAELINGIGIGNCDDSLAFIAIYEHTEADGQKGEFVICANFLNKIDLPLNDSKREMIRQSMLALLADSVPYTDKIVEMYACSGKDLTDTNGDSTDVGEMLQAIKEYTTNYTLTFNQSIGLAIKNEVENWNIFFLRKSTNDALIGDVPLSAEGNAVVNYLIKGI